MIESSVVLRTLLRLISHMKKLYDESLLSRIITGVSTWLINLLLGSYILGFFMESRSNQVIRESRCQHLMTKGTTWYRRGIGKALKQWFEGSLILRLYAFVDGFYLAVLLLIGTMIFLPTKLSMVLAGLVLVFYLYDTLRGVHKRDSSSLVGIMIGMFILLMVESVINAINFNNAIMIAAIYIIFILTTLAIGAGIATKKKLMLLLDVLMAVMLVSCLYAFYQFVVGVEVDAAWVDEELFGTSLTRIYSFFGNPNVYGVYLVMMVPIAIALFFSSKGVIRRLIYLGAIGAGLISIALTYSRGSMLSVALAIGIMLLFMDKRFIFLALAGVAAIPFVLPASIIQRIVSIVNMQDSSVLYRISIYRASADMIRDFFIGGLGLGGFNEVYFAYAYSASRAFHAHNTFLMVLIELGVFGFGLFLAILILWVKTLMSTYFRIQNRTYKMLILALIGGIAGASVQGLAEHIWFHSDVMFFYWLLIVLGLVVVKLARSSEVTR